MKANARNREILFKELPWTERVLPLDTVEFTVKLVDLDTLSLVPRHFECRDGTLIRLGKIFFVDGEGHGLGHVGDITIPVYHRMWSWRKLHFIEVKEEEHSFVKETVEEAIRRLALRGKPIRFIVEFTSKRAPSVTIYKVPKRISDLETWLDHKAREETQRLRDTLEEVKD